MNGMTHGSWIIPLILLLAPGLARADIAPGVDWYVANAQAVMLVRAQTEAEAKAYPPPKEKQRLLVREVYKGFSAVQQYLRPAGALKPGQLAVVLAQYEHPAQNEWAASPETKLVIWPLEKDQLLTGGVPARSRGKGIDAGESVMLQDLRDAVASVAPEEVAIYPRIIDAILFPEKIEALAQIDPDRATYVRFAAAVRDLDRDVPSLALLLEERDKTVRAAVTKKLAALTEADVARPSEETPAALHAWSEAWGRWWTDHKDSRVWDETKTRWVAVTADHPTAPRWPAVPASLMEPVDGFPRDLLSAVEKKDAAAFAPAFRAWIDGAVLRDRQIQYAMSLSSDVVDASHLGGAIGQSGPLLPPAPRLRADLLLNDNHSADERLKAVALFASLWHRDRFVAERARALEQLKAAPAEDEMVSRAAFWEPRRSLAGETAVRLLGKAKDAASGNLLLHLFTEGPMGDAVLDAARARIQAGDKAFVADLVAYVKKDRGSVARWAGRLLCQEHQAAVVPLQVEWLKDVSEDVRASAAFNLCWLPSADAVTGLIDALKVEKIARVRGQMLQALAQTGDKRGLDALLAAAAEDRDETTLIEFVRGLARIRDKRALPVLAELAVRPKVGDGFAWEVVNAFGYVSGLYKASAPNGFWSSGGVDANELAAGHAVIEKWRAEQKPPK